MITDFILMVADIGLISIENALMGVEVGGRKSE
jgi:hypothetical protein